ncbi:hypothetical protein LguiA_020414 [Lonicera macranthoides]
MPEATDGGYSLGFIWIGEEKGDEKELQLSTRTKTWIGRAGSDSLNSINNHSFEIGVGGFTGKRNVISRIEKMAKKIAFDVDAREVKELFTSQKEEYVVLQGATKPVGITELVLLINA